jgi:hypothetical protein
MNIKRRIFLRIAGIVAGLGLGGTFVITGLSAKKEAEATEYEPPQQALIVKRWAMVVDMSKFKTEEDYKRVIAACHSVHNVPDFGNSKDEIKWIWKDDYEHSFPGQSSKYMEKNLSRAPIYTSM